jgi:hypothetical protein
MLNQRQLYLFNRARVQEPETGDPALLGFERQWIAKRLEGVASEDSPLDLSGLRERLAQLAASAQEGPTESARYVCERMSLEEFRILVQEFAVDGLTEAQVFYYILPRLTLEAQMPMLRIMIDEFGCGNLKRAHTTLYVNLLRELGMPSDVEFYCERIEPACFEFVNLFYWLTLRADDPSYFAGAITYLETVIPEFFECYVQGCKRLGIRAHAYYSEHQHIDRFHAVDGHRLLRAMHAGHHLDLGKAWLGAQVASYITSAAFEAAVGKARRSSSVPRHDREQSADVQ